MNTEMTVGRRCTAHSTALRVGLYLGSRARNGETGCDWKDAGASSLHGCLHVSKYRTWLATHSAGKKKAVGWVRPRCLSTSQEALSSSCVSLGRGGWLKPLLRKARASE